MSYTATWTNANAQGRLDAAVHSVRLCDAQELTESINRRRLLTYQTQQDFSSKVHSGAWTRQSTIASASEPPFDNFRDALAEKVLAPPTGSMGGSPATPSAMDWLWPESDADEGKVLVSGAGGVGAGEVGLFQKLNNTDHWTNQTLTAGESPIRAVHFNELRQAVEWIRRGCWQLPLYLTTGIFSLLPDTPWAGEAIANNDTDELRSLGYAIIRSGETPDRGLVNVTARSSSYMEITADTNCTVEIYHCLRPIDYASDPPTWNEYDPSASAAWTTPGGTGNGDAVYLGSIALTADVTGNFSTSAFISALQGMIDGAEQSFLLRRSDTGPSTVSVTAYLTIEFDLDSPPN